MGLPTPKPGMLLNEEQSLLGRSLAPGSHPSRLRTPQPPLRGAGALLSQAPTDPLPGLFWGGGDWWRRFERGSFGDEALACVYVCVVLVFKNLKLGFWFCFDLGKISGPLPTPCI